MTWLDKMLARWGDRLVVPATTLAAGLILYAGKTRLPFGPDWVKDGILCVSVIGIWAIVDPLSQRIHAAQARVTEKN